MGKDEKDAKYWLDKGIELAKQGKHEEALKCFDKATKLKPNDAIAWIGKGTVLAQLKKYEEALKYFDKAIEVSRRLSK